MRKQDSLVAEVARARAEKNREDLRWLHRYITAGGRPIPTFDVYYHRQDAGRIRFMRTGNRTPQRHEIIEFFGRRGRGARDGQGTRVEKR